MTAIQARNKHIRRWSAYVIMFFVIDWLIMFFNGTWNSFITGAIKDMGHLYPFGFVWFINLIGLPNLATNLGSLIYILVTKHVLIWSLGVIPLTLTFESERLAGVTLRSFIITISVVLVSLMLGLLCGWYGWLPVLLFIAKIMSTSNYTNSFGDNGELSKTLRVIINDEETPE